MSGRTPFERQNVTSERHSQNHAFTIAGGREVQIDNSPDQPESHHRDRLWNVLDRIFTFVGLLSMEGVLLECNTAPLDMGGVRREDVIGKLLTETYWFSHSAEARDRARAAFKRARKGEIVHYDEMARGAGDKLIAVALTLNPVRNKAGEVVQVVGSAVDITARKETEAALQRSELNLAEAQELAKIGSWEFDVEREKAFWSAELYRLWYCDPSRGPVMPADFHHLVHPEDRKLVKKTWLEALKTGALMVVEIRTNPERGPMRYLSSRVRGVRSRSNRVIRLIGTTQDVTDRRHQEEERLELLAKEHEARTAAEAAKVELGHILESIADAFVSLDREGRFIYVNQKATQVLGKNTEELLGRQIWEEFPPAPGLAFHAAYHKAVADQSPVEIEAYYEPCKKWFESRIYPSPTGISVAFHDVSDRVQAQKQVRTTLEQVRALSARVQAAREEERTVVARELHDEIGQILAALKFEVAWVARRLPEAEKEMREKIDSALALTDSGHQWVRKLCTKLRPGILDDLGLLAAIEWQAREFEGRTGILCRLDLPPQELGLDNERSTAVFRILQEALTNVSRHSGATRVDISVCLKDAALLLVIGDNGKGIENGDLVQKRSFGLLGMRERALVFGGMVELRGKRGQGTRVVVSIPLAKPQEERAGGVPDTPGR